jgi:predicted nucleic acid-binding protein
VNTLVIDASVAVKWVIDEDGTSEALTLRKLARLIAPELLAAECVNILWKKVQRDDLSKGEAFLAARLLQAANIDFLPNRSLLEAATRIASNSIIRHTTACTLRSRLNLTVDLLPPTSDSCANSAKGTGAAFAVER